MILAKALSALLLAASVLSTAGHPSQQVVYFDELPPQAQWAALARESACAEVEKASHGVALSTGVHAFDFVLPVEVRLMVWEQVGDALEQREFFTTTVRGCEDV